MTLSIFNNYFLTLYFREAFYYLKINRWIYDESRGIPLDTKDPQSPDLKATIEYNTSNLFARPTATELSEYANPPKTELLRTASLNREKSNLGLDQVYKTTIKAGSPVASSIPTQKAIPAPSGKNLNLKTVNSPAHKTVPAGKAVNSKII